MPPYTLTAALAALILAVMKAEEERIKAEKKVSGRSSRGPRPLHARGLGG